MAHSLLLITWEPLAPPPLLLTMLPHVPPPRLLLTWDNTCHILEHPPKEILVEILRHTLVPCPNLGDDIAGVMRLRLCCKAFSNVVNDTLHVPNYSALPDTKKPWWMNLSMIEAVMRADWLPSWFLTPQYLFNRQGQTALFRGHDITADDKGLDWNQGNNKPPRVVYHIEQFVQMALQQKKIGLAMDIINAGCGYPMLNHSRIALFKAIATYIYYHSAVPWDMQMQWSDVLAFCRFLSTLCGCQFCEALDDEGSMNIYVRLYSTPTPSYVGVGFMTQVQVYPEFLGPVWFYDDDKIRLKGGPPTYNYLCENCSSLHEEVCYGAKYMRVQCVVEDVRTGYHREASESSWEWHRQPLHNVHPYAEAEEKDKEALYKHLGPIPIHVLPTTPVEKKEMTIPPQPQNSTGGRRRMLPAPGSWTTPNLDELYEHLILSGMRFPDKQ